LTDPSASWDVSFTVTKAGSLSWTNSIGLETACGDYSSVRIEGWIAVNGVTAIPAKTTTVSCVILQ
jgi:hypothetical protein